MIPYLFSFSSFTPFFPALLEIALNLVFLFLFCGFMLIIIIIPYFILFFLISRFQNLVSCRFSPLFPYFVALKFPLGLVWLIGLTGSGGIDGID